MANREQKAESKGRKLERHPLQASYRALAAGRFGIKAQGLAVKLAVEHKPSHFSYVNGLEADELAKRAETNPVTISERSAVSCGRASSSMNPAEKLCPCETAQSSSASPIRRFRNGEPCVFETAIFHKSGGVDVQARYQTWEEA